MSEWLDPTGLKSYGIALCGRCGQKFFLHELSPDPNVPGLYVCKADRDQFDPYRLPARQTENISLPFTRPDLPLTFDEDEGLAFVIGIEGSLFEAIGLESGGAIGLEE